MTIGMSATARDEAKDDLLFEPLRRLRTALGVIAAANACDFAALEPLIHPELDVPSVPGVAPGPGFRGVAGFRRYFEEAAANDFLAQAAVREARVTDAGNVIAAGRLVCTVKGEVDALPAWFVYRFRDDRVVAIETYVDEEAAVQAARTPSTDRNVG